MDGRFLGGKYHHKYVPLSEVSQKLAALQLKGLTLQLKTLRKEGGHRLVDGYCEHCKKTKRYWVDSLLGGKSTGCACQRNRKYGGDPRADMLGERYDCIIQRCNRDSHVQSKDYKGKYIKSEFESREHFIKWALEKWNDSSFKGLEFDRIDNGGNYSPDNLRLVTSRENHLNREDNVYLFFQGKKFYWADWPSPYSSRTTQSMAASGMTGEQIILRARETVANKHKNWRGIRARLIFLGYF